MIKTLITKNPNIYEAIDFVTSNQCGAINLFVGTVRNHNRGTKPVSYLFFDVHEVLVLEIYHQIVEEALKKWPAISIYMEHANGKKNVGEITIVIAVASAHRKESIESCAWLLEEVKTRLPVWKCEYYEDGSSHWINIPSGRTPSSGTPSGGTRGTGGTGD